MQTNREGSEEGSSGKNRDNQRGLGSSDIGQVILGVDVTGAEQLAPVVHAQDTANGTGIVTVSC